MVKRNFILLLSVLVLLNLVSCIDVSTTTRDYVPDIDRSDIPKNILIGSYIGGSSHIKPMLDITAILIERGYNIILLTSENYTPLPEYPDIKQISLGPRLNFNIEKKDPTETFGFRRFATILEKNLQLYNHSFETYKSAVKEYDISLFFCDVMINDACLDVAHALKKPVVGFSSILNMVAPTTYKSDPMYDCKVSLENESFLERFRCTIIQPIRILYLMYPISNQLNNVRKQVNADPVFLSMRRLSKTSLFLADTFFGFELPQSLPPNVQEIGPVMSDEYPPLTPELSSFINGHKRVLYVSFGTRFVSTIENNNKVLQSFIEAINKNIIDGVIWALSKTSKDDFSPKISLNDGTQVQTSPILNNEHPHVHIAEFVPQFSVLNHTNTKLFLSHGGAGSSHESLYTGTPMLILPLVGDQLGNAEKLKLSGIALTLDKLNLDVNDIVSKIDLLLKDENIKKNVRRLEVLTKINSKRKYRAADLIEYVLLSSSFNEGVNEEFLKEWIPANTRMGFIRGNNYDVYGTLLGIALGLVGGILWITMKLIGFIVKKFSSSANLKPKRD